MIDEKNASEKLSRDKVDSPRRSGPPRIFYLIFGLVFILSAFNIIKDSGFTNSLANLDFVQDVLAVTGAAPNSGQIVRSLQGYHREDGKKLITDSYDRCYIADPNLGGQRQVKDIGALGSVSLGDSLGGANTPIVIDFSDFASTPIYTETFAKAEQFGMSYVLALTTRRDTADYMAQFVTDANARGVVPIVRFCVVGQCDFDISQDASQITAYLRQVSSGTNGDFIALLGPNEPGTGVPLEMEGFGLEPGSYGTLVQRAVEAATDLQSLRAVNGGNMYLTPAAFNITNPGNDDAKEYFANGLGSSINLFDLLLVNTYDLAISPPDAEGTSAYNFYETTAGGFALRQAVEDAGIKTIVSEFGTLVEQSGFTQLEKSFNLFCEDETIEGVLFYRAFQSMADIYPEGGTLGVQSPFLIPDPDVERMTSSCAKAGSLRDYAWANCNFDSCIYTEEHDERSTAQSCGSNTNSAGQPALKIQCADNKCFVTYQDTIQVSMPIKQFGSNSPAGTPNFDYPSICADLALNYDTGVYDALNQFAGELRGFNPETEETMFNYPMPWLGSAINCSSELIKHSRQYFGTIPNGYSPSPGSSLDETKVEILDELSRQSLTDLNINLPGDPVYKYQGEDGEIINLITDERGLCLDDACLDKAKAESAPIYGEYTPASLASIYNRPPQCEHTDLLVRQEASNYILGPELYNGDRQTQFFGNGADVCIQYANREVSGGGDSNYVFTKDAKVFCSIPEAPPPECQPYIPILRTCFNEVGDEGIYHKGTCGIQLPTAALEKCLIRDANSSGDFYRANAFNAMIPDFDIPGVYDSLFEMYKRTQSVMSGRYLKIAFRENIGWEVKVEQKN